MTHRAVSALLAALALALALTATVAAHPRGNLSTDTHHELVASGDRLYVLSVLDLAEIPTAQEEQELRRLGKPRYASRLARRLVAGLELRIGGTPRSLRPLARRLDFPAGAAGLPTTRLELVLDAGPLARSHRRVALESRAFTDRLGWREIVFRAERGAAVAGATVPARSRSDRLRSYPPQLLSSPLDVRRATARIRGGGRAGAPPALIGP
jgi:hypothetical protein